MAPQTTSTALSIQVYDESDYVVVTPVGEIGVINSGTLRDRLFGLAGGGRPLVTDLNHVSLADAAGLGVLVGAANRVAAHGTSMYVVCTQQEMLRHFKQTGVDRKIQLVRTVDEAVRNMGMAPYDPITDDPSSSSASGLSRRAARRTSHEFAIGQCRARKRGIADAPQGGQRSWACGCRAGEHKVQLGVAPDGWASLRLLALAMRRSGGHPLAKAAHLLASIALRPPGDLQPDRWS